MRFGAVAIVVMAALLSACSGSDDQSRPADGTVKIFCDRAETFTAEVARLDGEDAPAAARVAAISAATRDLRVPAEIATDFERYVEGLRRFAAYVAAYKRDPSTATTFTKAESDRYERATDAVTRYLASTCGVGSYSK